MTTAYINGIVASDYLLVPVILDPMSVEGVARQLGWLRRMADRHAMLRTQLLGIVANRSGNKESLRPREQDLFRALPADYEKAWGDKVYCFRRHVFPTVRIADAMGQGQFAAFHPELSPCFQQLADELAERVVALESNAAGVKS
jgi:cellulose biosynthesis protein BcsQ